MPNLRGTYAKKWDAAYAKRPTLQNQITTLRRQVNQQKPETQWFRASGTLNAGPPGLIQVVQIAPITTQILASDFRDGVLGDQWKIKGLKLVLNAETQVTDHRVVIYKTKRAGTSWNPSQAASPFTEIPDPTAFTVVHDRVYSRLTTVNKQSSIHSLPLTSNVRYDSNSTVLEAGEFKIAILYYTGTNSGKAIDYSYCMAFENK